MIVWMDGRIEDADDDPRSRPPWVGFGVFTTVGCDRGEPLLWDRHRRRVEDSLEAVEPGLDPTLPTKRELEELLEACALSGPTRLRVVVRRRMPGGPWTVEASTAPAGPVGPGVDPVSLHTVQWTTAPRWTGHKTLARLAWDSARAAAREAGADDALLVDADGRLLETSIANVLVRFDRVVATPPAPSRCLPGIVRGWLMEHVGELGLDASERDVTLSDLDAADEVWITNAVIGVRRVAAVGPRRWSAHPDFDRLRQLGVPAPGWGAG